PVWLRAGGLRLPSRLYLDVLHRPGRACGAGGAVRAGANLLPAGDWHGRPSEVAAACAGETGRPRSGLALALDTDQVAQFRVAAQRVRPLDLGECVQAGN